MANGGSLMAMTSATAGYIVSGLLGVAWPYNGASTKCESGHSTRGGLMV